MMFASLRLALGALALLASQAVLADELPRKQFEIKEEQLGSRLPRVALRSEGLPLNRRWADLSDAEKALVRANYDGMPAVDEPPFPAQGLMPIFDAIKRGADKQGPLGTLTLVADVDSAGKVRHVDTFGKVDAEFARFASQVLIATPFKPALCAAQACNMQYVLRVQFGML
jgi:hypothetical protein